MSEVWTQWEGHVIDGQFPLLRCLGTSDHSGVFLTGHGQLPKAALKLLPAIPTLIEAQLAHWRAAAALPHPHLIRLYDSGRCQLGGRHFLFAVIEYAEQNLAEVLPHRALTGEEAREMLAPTLAVLSFLHGRRQVQGQLKPSNILVVGDQLKLASDTIRPAGDAPAHIGMLSVYDPLEAQSASSSTAGDIWALGVTLVEALTQRPPAWSDERRQEAVLPEGVPPDFANVVRRCLSHEPARRPSAADLVAWLGATRAPAAAAFEPAHVTTPAPVVAPGNAVAAEVPPHVAMETERRPLVPTVVGIAAVIVAAWAAVHLFSSHRDASPPPVQAPPAQVAQSPPETPGERVAPPPSPQQRPAPAAPPASASNTRPSAKRSDGPAVVHEEMPKVARSARATIRGHIRVSVRVTVDRSGAVVNEVLTEPGPSRYFARLAMEAARKWKFAPADDEAARQWLVRFEFSRDETTGRAVRPRSP
jgi:TonB family protein